MDNLPGSLERLNSRLDSLEQRIGALEQRIDLLEHADRSAAGQPAAAAAVPGASSPLLPEVPHWQAGGIFPVLGRAMLGIAGAYLLRALAESRTVPEGALEVAAIGYALLWMAAGARARAAFAAVVYACASVLILAPMLWELTLRFRGMPPVADAAALAALVGVAFFVAHGAQRAPVLRIANVSAAALCLGLAVATHANLTFIAVLLLIAALCEFAASGEKCARPLSALAADLGVWMLIYIYRAPPDTRAEYAALSAGWLIAPGILLFAIFAAGAAVRVGWRRQRITIFDTLQITITFLLAVSGLQYFGPASRHTILGLLCLGLAAVLYAAVLVWLRDAEHRSKIVFGTWSIALVLAGIWLSLPEAERSGWLSVAALAAVVAGAGLRKRELAWHGAVLLAAAAWASGLLAYSYHALAGTPAGAPSVSVLLAVICAILCYGVVQLRPETLRQEQGLPLLIAAIAALAATALLVQGCLRLAALALAIGPHHLALIRSLILCLGALALAFSGARWRRPELTHMGYAVVVLEAVKLVAEDLRHGHLAYVAASVCLFAFTLIAIPRVASGRRRRSPA